MSFRVTEWVTRVVLCAVFAMNVDCAVRFIADPALYAAAFQLSGVPGSAAIRGLGVAFLMWNATYPLVIYSPSRHRELFGVVIAQQVIGLVGETFIYFSLGAGYELLQENVNRFIIADAAGLIGMSVVFVILHVMLRRRMSR